MDDEALELAHRMFDVARDGGAAELAAYVDAGVPVDLALLRDQRMIEVSVITVDRARVMRRPNAH